jgi:hypothetical protein
VAVITLTKGGVWEGGLIFSYNKSQKTDRKLTAGRGMQDVFLFHKNALCLPGRGFSSEMKSLINPED